MGITGKENEKENKKKRTLRIHDALLMRNNQLNIIFLKKKQNKKSI